MFHEMEAQLVLNISQSSMRFSLTCHSFLVAAAILLAYLFGGSPNFNRAARPSREIEIRPVHVERASSSPVQSGADEEPTVAKPETGPAQPSSSRPAVTLPPSRQTTESKILSTPTTSSSRVPKTGLGRAYPTAPRRVPRSSQGNKVGSQTDSAPQTQSKVSGGNRKNPWGVSGATPTPPAPKTPKITREARLVEQPEIRLAERFPEMKSTSVKARFEVAADGSYQVTLIQGTGNLSADVLITGNLTTGCEWEPALKDGVPVAETVLIDIDLEQ